MDPRLDILINAFQSHGWKLSGSADISYDWWFSDILQLTSNRRPVGTKLYLTLLTDPQMLKEKIVWSIGFSSVIPKDRFFPFISQLGLNEIKKIDLEALVKSINKAVLG